MSKKRVLTDDQSNELIRLRLLLGRNATSSQSGWHDDISVINGLLYGTDSYPFVKEKSTDEIIAMIKSSVNKWGLT